MIRQPRRWVKTGWCKCPVCKSAFPPQLYRVRDGCVWVPRWIYLAFKWDEDPNRGWNENKLKVTWEGGVWHTSLPLLQIHNSGPEGIRTWLLMKGLAE